jgi:hypothetical protein
MEEMTTRLSTEQQQAVLYWPTAAEVPVFPADTKRKKISLKGWQETDFAKIDFRSKLDNGDYDDGIAIRTGKTIFGKYYLVAIDFDGIDAVLEWFGNWEQVIHFAKQTRIEWHGDKWRIHMFLFADRPIKNKRIHVNNSLLEVKCERQGESSAALRAEMSFLHLSILLIYSSNLGDMMSSQ